MTTSIGFSINPNPTRAHTSYPTLPGAEQKLSMIPSLNPTDNDRFVQSIKNPYLNQKGLRAHRYLPQIIFMKDGIPAKEVPHMPDWLLKVWLENAEVDELGRKIIHLPNNVCLLPNIGEFPPPPSAPQPPTTSHSPSVQAASKTETEKPIPPPPLPHSIPSEFEPPFLFRISDFNTLEDLITSYHEQFALELSEPLHKEILDALSKLKEELKDTKINEELAEKIEEILEPVFARYKKPAEKSKPKKPSPLTEKLGKLGSKLEDKIDQAGAKVKASAEEAVKKMEEKGHELSHRGKIKNDEAFRQIKSGLEIQKNSQKISAQVYQAKIEGKSHVEIIKEGKTVSVHLEEASAYANTLNQEATNLLDNAKPLLESGLSDQKLGQTLKNQSKTATKVIKSSERVLSNSKAEIKKEFKNSGPNMVGDGLGSSVAEVLMKRDEYSSGWTMAADCAGKTVKSTATQAASKATEIVIKEVVAELFPKLAEKLPGVGVMSMGYIIGKKVIYAKTLNEAKKEVGKTGAAVAIKMTCSAIGSYIPIPIVGTAIGAGVGTAVCMGLGLN